jgi:hypothetical protein
MDTVGTNMNKLTAFMVISASNIYVFLTQIFQMLGHRFQTQQLSLFNS